MTPRYLEQDFEEHIEEHLVQSGYSSLNPTKYDKKLCLIPSQLVEFIQESQPKTFETRKKNPPDTPCGLRYLGYTIYPFRAENTVFL